MCAYILLPVSTYNHEFRLHLMFLKMELDQLLHLMF